MILLIPPIGYGINICGLKVESIRSRSFAVVAVLLERLFFDYLSLLV